MTELALIAALGIGSQWIAWRLKLPSILFLLASGFLAGPIMGWLDPDAMLGDLLMPLVSVSVGLILYEGGLSLKFSELRETGAVVRNLVTIGALVVFVLAAAAARFALGWPWSYAFLAGAILTVTGPTVVAPMLRVIRPNRHLGAILKWEGIVIDPIGAVLALVVFEVILGSQSGNGSPLWEILGGFGKTALVGSAFGAAGAGLLILFFRRYWVPDYLHNPFSLMVVVLAFAGSNALQHESGLLATTLMGVILANQKKAKVRHIIEFKENLRVLLISTLFIMLSARITSAQIEALPWGRTALFAGILILAVRPLSVLASTLGQKIGAPEKAMLAGMAPRGIVAAAVASIFAAGLADKGVPGPAEQFAPAIFAVIVATVCVYGLLGVPLARLLGISSGGDRGVLIVGAQPLCREIGLVLKSEDIDVLMADTNRANATAARMAGLRSYYGNVLSDDVEEAVDLGGIGRVFAMTPNDEVNSLISVQLKEHFGSAMMYQPSMPDAGKSAERTVSRDLKARVLFRDGITLRDLQRRHDAGATIKKTPLTESFGMEQFRARYGRDALPLFLITPTGRLRVFTADDDVTPQPGDKLIAMISEPVGGAKPG